MCDEDDDEENGEKKYEIFRNMYMNNVWEQVRALMKCKKRKGGDGNGNNNDDEKLCGQDADGRQKASTILFITSLDALIIRRH